MFYVRGDFLLFLLLSYFYRWSLKFSNSTVLVRTQQRVPAMTCSGTEAAEISVVSQKRVFHAAALICDDSSSSGISARCLRRLKDTFVISAVLIRVPGR